jgi:hypothetical protein
MARQGRRHSTEQGAHCDLTYSSDVSVALLLSASESAAAPASPICSPPRLQRGEEGQGCSWRDTKALSRARARIATYEILVSVALLLSASESAAAPASPICSPPRLQRGEEGQGRSWRDTKAQSRARARIATYAILVSVALLLSASESAAAPASPI